MCEYYDCPLYARYYWLWGCCALDGNTYDHTQYACADIVNAMKIYITMKASKILHYYETSETAVTMADYWISVWYSPLSECVFYCPWAMADWATSRLEKNISQLAPVCSSLAITLCVAVYMSMKWLFLMDDCRAGHRFLFMYCPPGR